VSDSRSSRARKKAEAAFKSEDASVMTAAAELAAERIARDDKTARLRALRLAKEAADQATGQQAGPRRRK
jgi:hypothetical protein